MYCPSCPGGPALCSPRCFDEHHAAQGFQDHLVFREPPRRPVIRSPTASPPPTPSPVASRTRGARSRRRSQNRGRSSSRGRLGASLDEQNVDDPPTPPPGSPSDSSPPHLSPVHPSPSPQPNLNEPSPPPLPPAPSNSPVPPLPSTSSGKRKRSPKKRLLRTYKKARHAQKAKQKQDGTYEGLSSSTNPLSSSDSE